jgi:SAM-dependent methyltransferase
LVEPGAAGCRNAIKRGVQNVIHARLEDLRLNNRSAGAVLLLDVIEHLEDPQPLLAEARRILHPKGRLFVTVPAYGFLWSDEDEYAGHYRRYTRASLAKALQAAGFNGEFLTYFFKPLVAPVMLLRSLPYRLGMRKMETMDKSEHRANGLSGRVLGKLLQSELSAIERGGVAAFGTSLLAVASPGES